MVGNNHHKKPYLSGSRNAKDLKKMKIHPKNTQNHTKSIQKGVIGHDMALGMTWPQHNQQILKLITPKREKSTLLKKLILSKALNERVKIITFSFPISTDFFRVYNGPVQLCRNQLVS